jgi:GNAT superfamily N-acetyltransferase
MKEPISLRTIRRSDCSEITRQFAEQGWDKPESQYQAYCDFQELGARDVLIAELDGAFAGYLTIQWESGYLPFRERKVPEVVDFNVLKKYQRQGIGTRLMDEAERRIKQRSDYAGIGFGVYEDYGAAQILYPKRSGLGKLARRGCGCQQGEKRS